MKKYYYTLWKAHEGSADATLLEDEPIFATKHNSFKRAKELANELVFGAGFTILVRKVSLDSDMCTEWVFGATA